MPGKLSDFVIYGSRPYPEYNQWYVSAMDPDATGNWRVIAYAMCATVD